MRVRARAAAAMAPRRLAFSLGLAAGASSVQVTGIEQECANYLSAKQFASADDLKAAIGGSPCTYNQSAHDLFHPDPRPKIPGSTDTTGLECKFGNPSLKGSWSTCCGLRPHFNWVIGTCEATQATGQFCRSLPACMTSGAPKINYVAAYQFDGSNFVLMDESSVGEISAAGIAGNHAAGQGWEARKSQSRWRGGDWTTKYAPWASNGQRGPQGPRGVTPPAGMFVLSAENFYYGAFYMLSQLGINLEGMGQPTGTNCWNWELDPVEGTAGWAPGQATPGNINMMYSTDNAQASGCMPLAYMSNQMNGFRKNFSYPEDFRSYCAANPTDVGCQPWQEKISWSGGSGGSHRFENLWDEPYVFAVVLDARGYWMYRWRPAALGGKTGWQGLERYQAARTVPARPTPVRDPRGLKTDVPGDVVEAVMLQPSLSPEASCLRASIERVNWQFGANALASIALELGENGSGKRYEGAQNWWSHFVDTKQNAGYPMSVAGVPQNTMTEPLACSTPETFTCACVAKRADELLAKADRHGGGQERAVMI